mgnify:CR=1 FL=1
MPYQADVIGEPAAAYQAVLAPRPEIKVDNRAYAVAALGFWQDLTVSGPKPAFDPGIAPVQAALETLAAGYLDLLG